MLKAIVQTKRPKRLTLKDTEKQRVNELLWFGSGRLSHRVLAISQLFRKNATHIYGCSAILKKTREPFFLLGPRGTGKSCWTRKVFSDALRVDLLDATTLRELAARPERLRDKRMADGGWRMADGGWRMADGGWRARCAMR